MIVGMCSRNEDIDVNVCKKKHVTNMRAAGSDEALKLSPPMELTLEKCIELISSDELIEVTPKSIRMRKKILDSTMRKREASRKKQ
jgi:GTP-binding protein